MSWKLDQMMVFSWSAELGSYQVPAAVILRVLDARTDEEAVRAAKSVREMGTRYDRYSGESQDVIGYAWRVADWPDPDGTTLTERKAAAAAAGAA